MRVSLLTRILKPILGSLQLDWEANFKLTKAGKPSSKWYGVPKWVRAVSAKDLIDGKPTIDGISTKNRLSHLLLRLKWDDQPIHFSHG
jgi:hypothetical protein